MRYTFTCLVFLAFSWASIAFTGTLSDKPSNNVRKTDMQLGNFSISLTVKDIHASKEFYEKLGFEVSGGDLKKNYVILRNETSMIGLYQGMFDKNMLTYNPGWDRNKNTLAEFQDVREIQEELKKRGLNPVVAADENSTGTAYLTLVDPDGNPILIDQHVPKPTQKQ